MATLGWSPTTGAWGSQPSIGAASSRRCRWLPTMPAPRRPRVPLGAARLPGVGDAPGHAQLPARSRGGARRPDAALGMGRGRALRGLSRPPRRRHGLLEAIVPPEHLRADEHRRTPMTPRSPASSVASRSRDFTASLAAAFAIAFGGARRQPPRSRRLSGSLRSRPPAKAWRKAAWAKETVRPIAFA